MDRSINKMTAYKFQFDSAKYQTVEFNYDGVKAMVCFEDDVSVFSNKTLEVFSFNFNSGERTSRGALNNGGLVKPAIFNGVLYAGAYVRSKCTLFVERFDMHSNQWIIVNMFIINSIELNL